MIKVDLITGFLGSGKTTFLKKYVRFLLSQGLKIGVLENDYGAVNIDMMLLQELRNENCELEMVAGGCDHDCHVRRFRSKLIAMAMSGYDRVVVEPSGIFDVDEFFDVLHDEPLDRWYSIGSIIAIVDASLEPDLSDYSRFMLASQVADAGRVVLSKTQLAAPGDVERTMALLSDVLRECKCTRDISRAILARDWDDLTEEDFLRLRDCEYVGASFVKKYRMDDSGYTTLYYMHVHLTAEELQDKTAALFASPDAGRIFRIKGFIPDGSGWIRMNATPNGIRMEASPVGQEVLIVIGESLNKDVIDGFFPDTLHV